MKRRRETELNSTADTNSDVRVQIPEKQTVTCESDRRSCNELANPSAIGEREDPSTVLIYNVETKCLVRRPVDGLPAGGDLLTISKEDLMVD